MMGTGYYSFAENKPEQNPAYSSTALFALKEGILKRHLLLFLSLRFY
jgi:hypothetical protein